MLARALAVEGPRKGGVAAGPVLGGQFRGPLGDERGLPLAAEGDEGEDMGAARLQAQRLCQASFRSLVSSSRPMSWAGAYLRMREMSAGGHEAPRALDLLGAG